MKGTEYWGPFLQEKIGDWLDAAHEGERRTVRMLAARAKMTEQQLGQIKLYGLKASLDAAIKLMEPLGFASYEELRAAAEAWWSAPGRKRPIDDESDATGQPRLHDREEWPTVLEQAKAERPEIRDVGAFEDAGRSVDGELYPRPLTPRFVGNLAYVFFVQRSSGGERSS